MLGMWVAWMDQMSAAAPAAAQMDFFTVDPCRVYDSRTDGVPPSPPDPAAPPPAKLKADMTYTIPVAGECGVPAHARAVSLNVTVVGATGSGALQVFAAGTPPPSADELAFSAGLTRAKFYMVSLGTGGDAGLLSFLATVTPPPSPRARSASTI